MKKFKKSFFLIPGFKQKTSSKQFIWLVKFLEENGFRVLGIPIKWNRKTISDCATDFEKFYNKQKSEINYVLGFSYGAVVALLTANKLKPKKIYLCSLSPDFKEDISEIKPWIRKLIGVKRFQDIKTRGARELANELKIPSVIFYGESEAKVYPQLKVRCEQTAKLANKSKLILVKGAPHDISHPEYKRSIKTELSQCFKRKKI